MNDCFVIVKLFKKIFINMVIRKYIKDEKPIDRYLKKLKKRHERLNGGMTMQKLQLAVIKRLKTKVKNGTATDEDKQMLERLQGEVEPDFEMPEIRIPDNPIIGRQTIQQNIAKRQLEARLKAMKRLEAKIKNGTAEDWEKQFYEALKNSESDNEKQQKRRKLGNKQLPAAFDDEERAAKLKAVGGMTFKQAEVNGMKFLLNKIINGTATTEEKRAFEKLQMKYGNPYINSKVKAVGGMIINHGDELMMKLLKKRVRDGTATAEEKRELEKLQTKHGKFSSNSFWGRVLGENYNEAKNNLRNIPKWEVIDYVGSGKMKLSTTALLVKLLRIPKSWSKEKKIQYLLQYPHDLVSGVFSRVKNTELEAKLKSIFSDSLLEEWAERKLMDEEEPLTKIPTPPPSPPVGLKRPRGYDDDF